MKKIKTLRAVYKHVRRHLLAQKKKAVDKDGDTRTVTKSCMCSIGSMVPREWCDYENISYDGYVPFTNIDTTDKEDAPFDEVWKNEYEYDSGPSLAISSRRSDDQTMAAVAKYHGLKCSKRTARLFHDLERVHEDLEPKDWRAALDGIRKIYGF